PTPLIQLSAKSGQLAGMPPLSAAERERIQEQIKSTEKRRQEMFKGAKGKTNINQIIFIALQLSTQRGKLALYEQDGTPKLQAMGARERGASDSPLYQRGEVSKPGRPSRAASSPCSTTTPRRSARAAGAWSWRSGSPPRTTLSPRG